MNSMNQQQQQQPVNLDAMLGDLHSDMTRQGITTVPKGHCAACRKPIVGQVQLIYYILFFLALVQYEIANIVTSVYLLRYSGILDLYREF